MAKRLVINFSNDNNLQVFINACKQIGVEYKVLDDVLFGGLTPETVSDSGSVSVKVKTNNADKKFPNLEVVRDGKTNKAEIGDFVTVYSDIKGVRYWERVDDEGKKVFTPDKVKYGIKKSLVEAGASWDSNLGCYVFNTKKNFDAWCKAQKSRTTAK